MKDRTSTIRTREIGAQLRRYREPAGFSQRGAGEETGVSTPSMCRIEDGTQAPSPEDVATLLAHYYVTGHPRDLLLAIARDASRRGWWQRHNPAFGKRLNTLASLESRAGRITNFQMSVVPGLLQTPVYAEALMRSTRMVREEEIKARVAARIARRKILFADQPVHFAAFMDESVLYRMPGSAAVMHRQLDYLLHLSGRPNVIIRIVPMSRSVDLAGSHGFHMLRFRESPTVVHTENHASELYFEEPAEIAVYDDAVHHLVDAALDTGESAGLIARLMRTLEEDPDVLPEVGWPPLAGKQLQQRQRD